MKGRKLSVLVCLLCCAACAALAITPAAAHRRGAMRGAESRAADTANLDGRMILGTVVGVGGRLGGRTYPFRLTVNRVTPQSDVQRLNDALQSGGQDRLLETLRQMNAGRISIGNNVGVTANAIIESTGPEGGVRLAVLYERTLGFYELRAGARSENYRFGYAEMFLGGRDAGQGTFIPVARVNLRDGNTWEVEDFGAFPARLMGLQVRGGPSVPR
jgi:hypothetical protein